MPFGIFNALLGHKTCILLLYRLVFYFGLLHIYYIVSNKNNTSKWQNKCNLVGGGGVFFNEFLFNGKHSLNEKQLDGFSREGPINFY